MPIKVIWLSMIRMIINNTGVRILRQIIKISLQYGFELLKGVA